MARNLIYMGRYVARWSLGVSAHLGRVTGIKETIRLALGTNWTVSNVFYWLGEQEYYYTMTAGFIIRLLDSPGGNPTGQEWMFLFTNSSNTSSYSVGPAYYAIRANDTDLSRYWFGGISEGMQSNHTGGYILVSYTNKGGFGRTIATGTATGTPAPGDEFIDTTGVSPTRRVKLISIDGSVWTWEQLWGPKFGTYAGSAGSYGAANVLYKVGDPATTFHSFTVDDSTFFDAAFDDFAAATYVGGDGQLLPAECTPYNDSGKLAKLMPHPYNKYVRGVCTHGTVDKNNEPVSLFIIGDDIVDGQHRPWVGLYSAWNRAPVLSRFWLIGDILEPYDPADEDWSGEYAFYITNSAYLSFYGYPRRVGYKCQCVKPNGYRDESLTIYHPTTFDYMNAARYSDKTYNWAPVMVASNSVFKGWMRTDLIRAIGMLSAQEVLRMFEGPNGPLVKVEYNLAIPWVTGEPMVPPLRY